MEAPTTKRCVHCCAFVHMEAPTAKVSLDVVLSSLFAEGAHCRFPRPPPPLFPVVPAPPPAPLESVSPRFAWRVVFIVPTCVLFGVSKVPKAVLRQMTGRERVLRSYPKTMAAPVESFVVSSKMQSVR